MEVRGAMKCRNTLDLGTPEGGKMSAATGSRSVTSRHGSSYASETSLSNDIVAKGSRRGVRRCILLDSTATDPLKPSFIEHKMR